MRSATIELQIGRRVHQWHLHGPQVPRARGVHAAPPSEIVGQLLDMLHSFEEGNAHELDAILDHSLREDSGADHRRLTRAALESMAPKQRYRKALVKHGTQCSVCLSSLTTNRRVRVLPCGHIFCAQCIDQWACTEHACCPVCRAELSPPD